MRTDGHRRLCLRRQRPLPRRHRLRRRHRQGRGCRRRRRPIRRRCRRGGSTSSGTSLRSSPTTTRSASTTPSPCTVLSDAQNAEGDVWRAALPMLPPGEYRLVLQGCTFEGCASGVPRHDDSRLGARGRNRAGRRRRDAAGRRAPLKRTRVCGRGCGRSSLPRSAARLKKGRRGAEYPRRAGAPPRVSLRKTRNRSPRLELAQASLCREPAQRCSSPTTSSSRLPAA
jgi:hypothetical protein